MDLNDILFWLFDDAIGWVIMYLLPVAGIVFGVYDLFTGSIIAGLIWIGTGLFISVLLYDRINRRKGSSWDE